MPNVVRQINDTHPAAPELSVEYVAPGQCRLKGGQDVCHASNPPMPSIRPSPRKHPASVATTLQGIPLREMFRDTQAARKWTNR
jgi:hypothetical protein